jgi:hypothetical protein
MSIFAYKNKAINEIIGYETNFNEKCIEITEEEWRESEYGKYADINDNNEFIILEKPQITYADLRKQSYPPLEEQIDMLYHDIDNGIFGDDCKTGILYKTLKAVKKEYPKPIEDIGHIENIENAPNAEDMVGTEEEMEEGSEENTEIGAIKNLNTNSTEKDTNEQTS